MSIATKNKPATNPKAAKSSLAPVVKPLVSGLGLAGIGDLAGLLDAPAPRAGGPIDLSIDLIDEDPDQPRKEFDPVSLAEMAETIKARRVKTPISVRPNPDAEGRYLINHGARRYRASILAGKDTIPAFVDSDYTKADQVIENIQRDGLTPREIADYIGGELAKGVKKIAIAKGIGKSAAFVSQHVTLLDLPEPIADVFNSGRVSDVTVVNELVKAHAANAQEVAGWLAEDGQEITRGSVKLLREYLDDKASGVSGPTDQDAGGASSSKAQTEGKAPQQDEDRSQDSATKGKSEKEKDPETFKKAIVQVQHDGRPGRLILNRRPPADGFAWIKYEDDGHEFEAQLADVRLVAVLEG